MTTYFTVDDVLGAYDRIKGRVRRTPLEDSLYLGEEGRRYRFKLESQQLGKSFKIRGALNTMAQLTTAQMKRGVGTISTGNHGIAVSYAAKLLGIENCIVVVPYGTPRSKMDRIRFYGARVMIMGGTYDEALTLGINYIDRNELFYVDPGDRDVQVYAGTGTVGVEILKEHPKVDTIVVPVGSGALATGIAVAVKGMNPSVRVVGVQTAACPSMYRSIEDGVRYSSYPTEGETICEAVVGGVGQIAFEMLPDILDAMVVVGEEDIRDALRFMIVEEQLTIEGGSAMVVAAVREFPEVVGGSDVALVITGGNADGETIADVLHL